MYPPTLNPPYKYLKTITLNPFLIFDLPLKSQSLSFLIFFQVMDSGPSNPSQSNHGTTPTSTPASGSMVQHRLHSSQAPPDAAAAASGNSSSVQSKRKNHSIAWDHFTLMKNPDGTPLAKPRAKCNHCPQTYGCDTRSNGTSNMKNHLLFNCPKCPLRVPKKQKQLVISFLSLSAFSNTVYTVD